LPPPVTGRVPPIGGVVVPNLTTVAAVEGKICLLKLRKAVFVRVAPLVTLWPTKTRKRISIDSFKAKLPRDIPSPVMPSATDPKAPPFLAEVTEPLTNEVPAGIVSVKNRLLAVPAPVFLTLTLYYRVSPGLAKLLLTNAVSPVVTFRTSLLTETEA